MTQSSKVRSKKLRRLLDYENLPILYKLSRKVLINHINNSNKTALLKLSSQRSLNLPKKLSSNKLKQIFITDINFETTQKELLNKYSDQIQKIREC